MKINGRNPYVVVGIRGEKVKLMYQQREKFTA